MKKIFTQLIGTALLSSCIGNPKNADSPVMTVGVMPSLESGFEKGVSACYGTVYNENLYIAGGCNFPDKPVTAGGTKRYYKGIFSIRNEELGMMNKWIQVGEMPMTSAYGANIHYDNYWIIAGGMNEDGATKKVFRINLDDGCTIEELPELPCAVDNTAGTAVDGRIYVVGGNADGKPSNKVFVLDINDVAGGWSELAAMPSRGRVQPVCAATRDALFVWGGFSPADENDEAVAYTDGLRYDFATNTWKSLPDVIADEEKITFTGGTAALVDESAILVAGGVNCDIFTDAISGRYELVSKADYMHKDPEWYRFNQYLMIYDIANNVWKTLDKNNVYARAGALLLLYGDGMLYIGGELKPGVRTPEIHRYAY